LSTWEQLPAGWCRMHDKTIERADENGVYCSDRWCGPWSTRNEFLRIARGQEETIEYPGGFNATRIIPLKYPGTDPIFDNVYARSVAIESEGASFADDDEAIGYTKAIATVDYQSWPFPFPGGGDYPLMTKNLSSSAEVITVPGTAYEFPSDSLRLDRNAGILIPITDFALTFHFVPTLNDALSTSLCGFVNSTTFLGYAAGFVSGQYTHTVTHGFRWRRIKHNELMRPDGTAFEAPERVGSSDNLLPTGDLNALFGN
jgi:hypothetical protein